MKIVALIERETGEAILFFPDDVNPHNKNIGSYQHVGQHSEACRAYMRHACREPKTEKEHAYINSLLVEWGRMPC
jgi:hypothetical protein